MASSDTPADSAAARQLGILLTGTEAREIASHLADGDTLTVALRVVAPGRRAEIRDLLEAAGGGTGATSVVTAVLRAIEGARSAPTTVEPLWTMPGHLAQHGRLTQSVTYLVDSARHSVICSTFNFQRSSGLWEALRNAAQRPELTLRVYLDTNAADRNKKPWSPTTVEVAAQLHPATVLRSKRFGGVPTRNHAKFISIDHRFLLVTSANFSRSAETGNLELGVRIDNANLAEAVEYELRQAEGFLFEQISKPR